MKSHRNPKYLTEEYIHKEHNDAYRCLCGEQCLNLEEWQRHSVRAIVRQIIIDHRQQIRGCCDACGRLPNGASYAEHLITMIEKAGFVIARASQGGD